MPSKVTMKCGTCGSGQQDKERIERLETAIRWMMALPKDSRRDMKATGRAALAVEEDAPE